MEAFGTRMRGGLATMLSVALIVSGALLAAPAANAEEVNAQSETAAVEAPAVETPAEEVPTEEEPVEAPAPVEDASADAPEVDAPGESEIAASVPLATSAFAEAATLVATVVGSNTAGLSLKFDFTGVPKSTLPPPRGAGLYVALVEAGAETYLGSGHFVPDASITDGSGTGSYVVSAADLDRTKSYEALAWYAHGRPTADSIVVREAITVTDAEWDAVFPKSWAPALTSVALADGTPLAAGDKVYKDDTIIVSGTGFDPEANIGGRGRPIPATLPQGSYVTFTQAEDIWQPSVPGSTRIRNAASEKWVLAESVLEKVPSQFQDMIRNQWVALAEDGSWSAEIKLTTPANPTSTGVYGVYTYGAGGVNNASQELKFMLDYSDTVRPDEPVEPTFKPEIQVYLADGTTPYTGQELEEGDELVVKGSGFDPFANLGGIGQPIPADKPQGTFVVFGKFADDWKPSEKATSDKRTMNAANRGWLLAESTLENDVPPQHRDEIRTQWVELDEETGSFSWRVSLKEPSSPITAGRWGIYTYAGGVNTSNASQELSVPLNYTPSATTEPEAPAEAVGALQWGIYSNFRNYVEGNPDGRVETLGAATRTGDIFGFTQTSGGVWDAQSETGDLRFSGGVAFFAHGDALSLTIENPILQVTDSGAVLTARFDHGPQTPFADVDLSAATRSMATDGSVTWTGATTELREEGVAKFLNFYPVGTQLDPLTFTAGAEAELPRTPQIEITGVNVVAGQGLKVDVKGSQLPGGIYAALIERGTGSNLNVADPNSYAAFALPFPTVTDGVASFSLVGPAEKLDRKKLYEVLVWRIHSQPGEKTTYGQANVSITAAQWDKLEGIEPPVVEPGVTPKPTIPGAGSLTWGVSTPFADYVTGNISKGTVATDGVGGGRGGYVFPQATGSSWNAETRTGTVYYSGSVTFIGHGGLLRETYANPVITVNSPVSGTISASGQSFPLNLAAAGFSANADGSATWSNVPVSGVISGGDGGGAGGTLSVDSLTFTVGSASGLNFGSTSTISKYAATRTAAATPPSATGLTVSTPAAKLVAGGEIEITAGGFEPNEQGILVVIYSEPTVLDTNAKADKDGVVRWIGKLPKELTGKHTITLQGSISVGQEIMIAAADSLKKVVKTSAAPAASGEVQRTGALQNTGTIAWVWWTGALALLVAAGATTGLVVTQRRKNAAANRL